MAPSWIVTPFMIGILNSLYNFRVFLGWPRARCLSCCLKDVDMNRNHHLLNCPVKSCSSGLNGRMGFSALISCNYQWYPYLHKLVVLKMNIHHKSIIASFTLSCEVISFESKETRGISLNTTHATHQTQVNDCPTQRDNLMEYFAKQNNVSLHP